MVKEKGEKYMALTKKQFDILVQIEKSPRITQRALSAVTGISLATVNTTLAGLSQEGLYTKDGLTEKGILALEPYRVQRAVIMAAGFGSRLVPVTLNTPKPLVRVNGVRIIDSLLDALLAAGIEEIYLVRGYLAEQFDQLLVKYPMIKFINNPFYNEANSISSAICAKEYLHNAYICEADLLIKNPGVITKYQYSTNYLGVPVEKTDDWCLITKNGYATKLAVGGTNCHHIFGISYWTEEDGARLSNDLPLAYEQPGGRERIWDQVALEIFPKEYKIQPRPCTFEDIIEIDTFKELCAVDPAYSVKYS